MVPDIPPVPDMPPVEPVSEPGMPPPAVPVAPAPVVPVEPVPIEPFAPGVVPGGFAAGEVVVFGSVVGVVGPAPLLPAAGDWFGLLVVWANAAPPKRASAAVPQSAKRLICV